MKRFFITLSILLLGLPRIAFGAVMFTEPSRLEVTPQAQFEVAFFLDTQDEDINALEGIVVFPTDLLELKEVRDGNSIINFWVDRPVQDQAPVAFSGIIPGGYRFPKGLVLSLIFEAKQEGQGIIRIENARTLRNDGQGTPVPLSVSFSSVVVSKTAAASAQVAPIVDTVPPEAFRPELSRDPEIFDGQWFLSFATQDKGSGIDRFEVQESYAWGKGSWMAAASPYVLRGQNPAHPISVKAVDRSGNERIDGVVLETARRIPYEAYAALGILLVLMAVAYRRKPVR